MIINIRKIFFFNIEPSNLINFYDVCNLHKVFFFILVVFSLGVKSEESITNITNNPDYYEAFIELRVGKQGDPFFQVVMNKEEVPYIEINSFINSWIGIKPNCTSLNEICQIELPVTRDVHWINTSSKEFGINKNIVKWSRNDAVISYNNNLWIAYDQLNNILPVNSTWSIKSYILSIIPKFKLAKERIVEIEIARKREALEKYERDIFTKEPAIKAESNQFYEGRVSYTSSFDFIEGEHSKYINYDLSYDLMGGTFGVGGDFENSSMGDALGYYFYENKEIDNLGYVALGDIRFEGNLISNGKAFKNGLRVDRYYREDGIGGFSKKEFTKPNSLVDIYINGFYQETISADKFGFYVVDNISVKSGDVVKFREVSPQGVETEKKHVVVGANGSFVDKGDWDSQFFIGESDEHVYSYMDIKYGLYEHFTVGVQNYVFDSFNRDLGLYQSKNMATAILLWRYNNNVSLSVESDLLFSGNNAYRVDWIINPNSYFVWDARHISKDSNIRDLEWFNSDGYDYNRFKYNLSYGRYQVKNTLLFSEIDRKYDIEINKKLQGRYSLLFNNAFDFNQSDNFFSELILNKSMLDGGTVEVGVGYRDKISSVFGRWRFIGKNSAPWVDRYIDNPWTSTISFSYDNKNKFDPALSFDWQQTEWISGSFSATTSSIYLGLTAKLGFSHNKGIGDGINFQSWDRVGDSSIEGYLLAPLVNGVREPLRDVEVNVSNYSGRTDENGYFFIDSIPANYEMDLFINNSTLDIRLLPKKKKWKVYFRPGTKIKLNPEMTWAVGIDGRVYSDILYSLIRFTHIESGLVLESALDEYGYYILERLTPGKYTVEIIGQNNKKIIRQYTLGMGDWFSDVDFNI